MSDEPSNSQQTDSSLYRPASLEEQNTIAEIQRNRWACEDVSESAFSESRHVRRAAAASPLLSRDAVSALLDDPCVEVRETLAMNPALTADDMAHFLQDPDPRIRSLFLTHRQIHHSLLADWLQEAEVEHRVQTAEREDLPAEIIEMLSVDAASSVRLAVAANVYASASVLQMLAGDRSKGVRAAVASNSSAPSALLASMAEQQEGIVIDASLAANPVTPMESLRVVLERHMQSDSPDLSRNSIAEAICDRTDIPDAMFHDLLDKHGFQAAKMLIENQTISTDVLEHAVARFRSAPVERLWWATVLDVINHPSVNGDILADLVLACNERGDFSKQITELANSPHLNFRTIRTILGNAEYAAPRLALLCREDIVEDEFVQEIHGFVSEYREHVAEKSKSPAVLGILASDRVEAVRLAVVANANTPIEMVALLAWDENPDIARAATEVLEKHK